jgi:hypothetical protein
VSLPTYGHRLRELILSAKPISIGAETGTKPVLALRRLSGGPAAKTDQACVLGEEQGASPFAGMIVHEDIEGLKAADGHGFGAAHAAALAHGAETGTQLVLTEQKRGRS